MKQLEGKKKLYDQIHKQYNTERLPVIEANKSVQMQMKQVEKEQRDERARKSNIRIKRNTLQMKEQFREASLKRKRDQLLKERREKKENDEKIKLKARF